GWLEQLAAGEALAYAGFNLLVADGRRLWHLHRGCDGLSLERLAPGVHGLSNANLDTPWPKLVRARRALARSLENGGWPAAALAAFADERLAPDAELPDTGMGVERERQLSAAFIHGRDYGTRATTCLEWRADGRLEMHEARYGPEAAPLGSRRLVISAPPAAAAEPESVGVRR
ncbi:MAG TPA: NRDE family protein, partial [Halomonas sp.]|nr:NRDE family protein [Halomonas sp.]